jgi:hypothetical protein
MAKELHIFVPRYNTRYNRHFVLEKMTNAVTYLTRGIALCYTLIIWHRARALRPQVSHAWFSVMDELPLRNTVYQIAVSLMKCSHVVLFLLQTTIDIFSWQPQQKIRFRTSMSRKKVKQLFNEVLSGYQPHQVSVWNRRFENRVDPYHLHWI